LYSCLTGLASSLTGLARMLDPFRFSAHRAYVSSGGAAAGWARRLRGGHRWTVVGRGVGAAGAGVGGCSMELESAARDECCALRLPRMRYELRPLCRPRWHEQRSCSHVVVRGADSRFRERESNTSSSLVGLVLNQLNCTTWSSIGGCGFRAICLTKVD
jgi:hypothetical protein